MFVGNIAAENQIIRLFFPDLRKCRRYGFRCLGRTVVQVGEEDDAAGLLELFRLVGVIHRTDRAHIPHGISKMCRCAETQQVRKQLPFPDDQINEFCRHISQHRKIQCRKRVVKPPEKRTCDCDQRKGKRAHQKHLDDPDNPACPKTRLPAQRNLHSVKNPCGRKRQYSKKYKSCNCHKNLCVNQALACFFFIAVSVMNTARTLTASADRIMAV